MDQGWVFFRVYIPLSPQYSPCVCVISARKLTHLLRLGLNWLGFCETALKTESLGRHILVFSIFSLHLELISFGKEFVNCVCELLNVSHAPLPLVAVVAEMFPAHLAVCLRPVYEKCLIVIGRHERHFSDNSLILLKFFHDLYQIPLCYSLLILVERSKHRLDLVFFPFNQRDLRVTTEGHFVFKFFAGNWHMSSVEFLFKKGFHPCHCISLFNLLTHLYGANLPV